MARISEDEKRRTLETLKRWEWDIPIAARQLGIGVGALQSRLYRWRKAEEGTAAESAECPGGGEVSIAPAEAQKPTVCKVSAKMLRIEFEGDDTAVFGFLNSLGGMLQQFLPAAGSKE